MKKLLHASRGVQAVGENCHFTDRASSSISCHGSECNEIEDEEYQRPPKPRARGSNCCQIRVDLDEDFRFLSCGKSAKRFAGYEVRRRDTQETACVDREGKSNGSR